MGQTRNLDVGIPCKTVLGIASITLATTEHITNGVVVDSRFGTDSTAADGDCHVAVIVEVGSISITIAIHTGKTSITTTINVAFNNGGISVIRLADLNINITTHTTGGEGSLRHVSATTIHTSIARGIT